MLEVYSLKLILDLISSWGKTNELTIEQLQQKAVLLIDIATMWRPRFGFRDAPNQRHPILYAK
jgi:hypothetical protein